MVLYIDRFIEEIGALDQASAQWTLAQLFARLFGDMSKAQKAGALQIVKRNLAQHSDWIVLNASIETLSDWARSDERPQSLATTAPRKAGGGSPQIGCGARKEKAGSALLIRFWLASHARAGDQGVCELF